MEIVSFFHSCRSVNHAYSVVERNVLDIYICLLLLHYEQIVSQTSIQQELDGCVAVETLRTKMCYFH